MVYCGKSATVSEYDKLEGENEMKTEKIRKPHPVRHGIGMALSSLFLVLALLVSMLAMSFSGLLNSFLTGVKVDVEASAVSATAAESRALSRQVEAEGLVLLRNEKDTLPLSKEVKQVNVFGWSSTQWLGGGSGSGRVTSCDVGILEALEAYGVAYNHSLSEMYRTFQPERPYASNTVGTLNSYPEQSCRLYEPAIDDTACYSDGLLSEAKAYSDTALVVLSRFAGESSDCPQVQYKQVSGDGSIVVDESRTYLDLSAEEEALLAYVGENYEHVVVILNTGNVMALGAVETIPGVDACVMAGLSGQYAAEAIPGVLWGEISPSGRTADTWAYDFATAASYANAAAGGVGAYTGAEGRYPADGTTSGNLGSPWAYDQVSFVDYAEGIYMGYKWYETADAEGFWDDASTPYGTGYGGVVQYPFGYGLSYTNFGWEVLSAPAEGAALDADGKISFTVRVTNTGTAAGKDVVQLYYTPPYTPGGIEKSAVNLAAFAKTELLQPGQSQEVTLTLPVEDMASYDCYDLNSNGFLGYELDEGRYTLSLRRDAHTPDDGEGAVVNCTLARNAQYPVNRFSGVGVGNKVTGAAAIDGVSLDGSDSGQEIPYLTRADFKGSFPTANVERRPMAENVAELNLYTAERADAWVDENDLPITTGVKSGLLIEQRGVTTDLGFALGEDYDDPRWDKLLDQLTVEEMENLVLHGYVKTGALKSVGKPETKDVDGPSQIGSFNQPAAGTGFPNAGTMAQTWNGALARDFGRAVGTEAGQLGYSGWYAPAVNMHRSPFNGRNYEYYSEDSLLSGEMCGNTVAGSLEAGVFCYVKHFLCNDGESGIYRDGVYTWMSEQTLRELYLEPFRIIAQEYGATGLMTAYGRIGAVWAGGSEALLTGVLREEWGFRGAVITDFSDHHAFMNIDQALRAGGDIWMDGFGGEFFCETTSNSFQQELRRASKNVLYMYLNARTVNRDYSAGAAEPIVKPILTPNFPVWKAAIVAVDVLAVLLFVLAIRSLVVDHRLRKAAKTGDAKSK